MKAVKTLVAAGLAAATLAPIAASADTVIITRHVVTTDHVQPQLFYPAPAYLPRPAPVVVPRLIPLPFPWPAPVCLSCPSVVMDEDFAQTPRVMVLR